MTSDESRNAQQRNTANQVRVRCPVCQNWIMVSNTLELWDQVDCPSCFSLLEVVDRRPLTLDVVESDYDEDLAYGSGNIPGGGTPPEEPPWAEDE